MKLKANPDAKAWSLLKSVINNDSLFFTLKTENKPIEVTGNLGGKYFIYPNGCLARIDSEQPFIGKVKAFAKMPIADRLAAIYIWITQKEADVKQLWGCGNIDLYYNDGEISNGHGMAYPTLRDLTVSSSGEFNSQVFYTSYIGGSVAFCT